ncbi:MAG: hypothetical protein VYB50_02920 [Candidatus Thermoplasmatota archaeon]|nr:hypothetical protein [Candidatus Thermoplasmatota archaeon]
MFILLITSTVAAPISSAVESSGGGDNSDEENTSVEDNSDEENTSVEDNSDEENTSVEDNSDEENTSEEAPEGVDDEGSSDLVRGCPGGTLHSLEMYSGMNGQTSTLWVTLALAAAADNGEPVWSGGFASAKLPLAQDWNESRIQDDTTHFSSNAELYQYQTSGAGTPSPGGSQYIWMNTASSYPSQWSSPQNSNLDFDFNGLVGLFAFRHDFNLPNDAFNIQFSLSANADDFFIKDPNTGTNDFSIRQTSALNVPLTGLSPNPSDTHPNVMHIGSHLQNNPLFPATSSITTLGGVSDLSLVMFVENTRLMGALGYHFIVKYCIPEPTPTPFNIPAGGNLTQDCGANYDAGLVAHSSILDTGYRNPNGNMNANWYQSAQVDGTYSSGSNTIWSQANTKCDNGGPVHSQSLLNPSTYSLVSDNAPTLSEYSQWVWNGDYIKQNGLHEFGQVVDLQQIGMPNQYVITDLDVGVYFSADRSLISIDAYDFATMTPYGNVYTDVNTIQSSVMGYAPVIQYDKIIRSGNPNSNLIPLMASGAFTPTANSDLLVTFRVTDQEMLNTPQGQIEGVDPAGLRYSVLICIKWEDGLTPITPPSTSDDCESETESMYSGQDVTEIRALQRDNAGQTTWVQGVSTSPTSSIPAHFEPEPWQDMEVLRFDTYYPPGVQAYSILNAHQTQYLYGYYHNDLGPQASDASLRPIASAQGNLYQPHNPNASWMMYGNPIVDGTVRTPGMEKAHYAPAGLKEVLIPFTIPTTAESGTIQIIGDLGVSIDVSGDPGSPPTISSLGGYAYIYPACMAPTLAPGTSSCVEDAMFEDFTHGISIVSQASGQYGTAIESVSADIGYFVQVDGRTNGAPIQFNGIQNPGDYYLKFYVDAEPWYFDITSPLAQQNYEFPSVYPPFNPVTREEFTGFALSWSFDITYEDCTPPSSGGSSSGFFGFLPSIPLAAVLGIVIIAAFVKGTRDDDTDLEN